MVDLSTVLEALSGASTIAVILGVPFIALQMRQNARMLEAANKQTELVASQNRAQVFLSISERLTDHDFVLQRKAARDIVAKYVKQGWEAFIDSADGFEIRAFAVQYESVGLMAKLGLIDETTLVEAFGFTIVVDWGLLAPALEIFEKEWGRARVYPNFHRVATAAEKYWAEKGVHNIARVRQFPSDGAS